jgi:hypothetical protein
MPRNVVPVFQKLVREKVTELLVELDNWLSPYSADRQPESEYEKVGLAVFQFIDPAMDTTPLRDQVVSEQQNSTFHK